MIRVAINGYGRIGRVAHRVILEKHAQEIDVVAINAGSSTDIKGWMYLLKYDTAYGPLSNHKLEIKPQNPTLKDFQKYVIDLENERGFTDKTVLQKCLMLGEEMGELFQAIRKEENITIDHNSKFGTIEEELADVIIYICSIANSYNINLEEAFRKKEEVNKKRIWKKSK